MHVAFYHSYYLHLKLNCLLNDVLKGANQIMSISYLKNYSGLTFGLK